MLATCLMILSKIKNQKEVKGKEKNQENVHQENIKAASAAATDVQEDAPAINAAAKDGQATAAPAGAAATGVQEGVPAINAAAKDERATAAPAGAVVADAQVRCVKAVKKQQFFI